MFNYIGNLSKVKFETVQDISSNSRWQDHQDYQVYASSLVAGTANGSAIQLIHKESQQACKVLRETLDSQWNIPR